MSLFSRKSSVDTQSARDYQQGLKESNIGQFEKKLEALYAAGGGKVVIWRRADLDGTPSRLESVPIGEASRDPDFLGTVLDDHGAAYYSFEVYNHHKSLDSTFHFPLGKLKEQTARKKKKKESDDNEAAPKGRDAFYLAIMKQIQDSSQAHEANMIEVLKSKSDGGMSTKDYLDLYQKERELSERRLEAMSGRGDGIFEGFLQGVEFHRQIAPEIKTDDNWSNVLMGALQFLGQMLSARGSGQSLTPNPQQIGQLEQALTYLKGQQSGSAGAQSPAAVNGQKVISFPGPPAPGQPDQPAAAGATRSAVNPEGTPGMGGIIQNQESAPQASEMSAQASPAADEPPEHVHFYNSHVVPFRNGISAGIAPDPDLIARRILGMRNYNAEYLADMPHPLFREFLEAESLPEMEAAYYGFCARIPELAKQQRLIEAVKSSLIGLLTEAYSMAQVFSEAAQEGSEDGVDAGGITDGQAEVEAGGSTEDHGIGPVDLAAVSDEDVPG